MPRHPALLAIALALAPGGAVNRVSAAPITLFGEIGKGSVLLFYEPTPNAAAEDIHGWRISLDRGQEVEVAGRLEADGTLSLKESINGKPTGAFHGKAEGSSWTGEWRSADGKTDLPFALRDVKGRLAVSNINVTCRARWADDQHEYVYTHDLALRIAAGKVKTFAMSRVARSHSDEQSCQIELKSLEQTSDRDALTLTTGAAPAADQPACEISIVGDAAHLFIKVGNCRSADDEMFCSPRGAWTDMIVDRATGRCRSVQ